MKHARAVPASAIVIAILSLPSSSAAQATVEDYRRAMSLRERYQNLAVGMTGEPRFVEKSNRFYYWRTVKGGEEFILVDAAKSEKRPAFDHQKFAAALTTR